MGQQQLLLIVLGVIIVGIAVVVGINLFNANAEEAAKDGIVSDCTNLGAMAQQHYKKPGSMGGGSNSFDGTGAPNAVAWAIPANLINTANGTYSIVTLAADQVIIQGLPLATSGYNFTVVTTIDNLTISTVIN